MALSGSFSKYPVSKFGLYCEWSGSQSITGNYTDVTLKVYLQFYTLSVGSRSDCKVSINGTSETYTTPAINDMSSTSWHKVLLKTKTVRVSHNSDGTKTGVALSASWRFSGTYSGVSVGTITASTTVNLDKIDRSAPTVAFSTSGVTASGFKISATSSSTADIWQYSLNGGSSWTTFSNTASTSASVTVSSLSPNTSYTVKVRARKKSNQVYGTSGSATVKTLGGAVVNSVSTVTADNATVTVSINATVYEASYSYTLAINLSDHFRTFLDKRNRHPHGYAYGGTAHNAFECDGIHQILYGNFCRHNLQRFNADRQYIEQNGSDTDNICKFCADSFRIYLRGQLQHHCKYYRQQPALYSGLFDFKGNARNGDGKKRSFHL